jgi:hypothetical protein
VCHSMAHSSTVVELGSCNTHKFKEIRGARYVFHHNPRIIVVIHIT